VSTAISASAPVPFVPAFTFTSDERAYQDRRLRSVISSAWEKEEGIAFWRNTPEIKCVHRQWARSYRVPGTEAWSRYREMVLAMAWSAADYFVPVDFWPHKPPYGALNQKQQETFRDMLNTQRKVAGVFSPENLRANKHYALLFAHLIWCPDPIQDAAHPIAPPYPWPFVVRIEGRHKYIERQEDIADNQWEIAERIERKLFRDTKQARAYGVSAASLQRQKEAQDNMTPVRRAAGRAITHAYNAYRATGTAGKDIIGAIMDDPTVKAAFNVPGAKIRLTPRTIRALHKEDCLARGLDLSKRGRPPKR